MPRWPERMLKGTFFVFPSEEDARKGAARGGCGFFVSVPCADGRAKRHTYAVTCDHVILGDSPHVIRETISKSVSASQSIPAPRHSWHIDAANDLAVKLMKDLPYEDAPIEGFLTDEIVTDYSIGIGDEVVSVGRFVDLVGHRTNRPLVRSGVIAAMPAFPVHRDGRGPTDSYIVEMRSRSGFSGSPVFVYSPPPQIRYEHSEKEIATRNTRDALIQEFKLYGPWLLGVHWGEIPVRGPMATKAAYRSDADKDWRGVELGSGMIGVVPFYHLRRLLMESENMVRERDA